MFGEAKVDDFDVGVLLVCADDIFRLKQEKIIASERKKNMLCGKNAHFSVIVIPVCCFALETTDTRA
jgi:hypothetical protein